MQKTRLAIVLSSLFILSIGLSFFLTIYSRASSYTILSHSFNPSLLPLIFFILIIFAFLVLTWQFIARFESKFFNIGLSAILWEDFIAYLPFGISLFSPFLLKYFLISEDLKIRLNLLAAAMVIGFIYLKLVQINRHLKGKTLLEKWLTYFSGLSLKKKLLILFILAFIVYNLCTTILVSKGIAYSGDEPYYLLTSHSLYQDKDINVANNYDKKDYFHFFPREFFPNLRLGAYARFGRKGTEYVYPINQPGLSVLILPYYWLSQFFQGRTLIFILKGSLSIWAVLLGLQFYLLSRELWKNEKISLMLWFFYSFSAPILFYSIHLYPEVLIALFSVYIFRKIRSEKKLSLFHYFFLGFLLSLFPWFGLKYNMIFWPFLLVSVYFFFKNQKAKLKILGFFLFPLLSQVLFYFYIYELYGTFNPIAVYQGAITPEQVRAFKDMVLKIPIMRRIDTLLDYFLDQRDGLFLYSPIYFFAFLGIVEVFRRAKRDFFILLFIAVPYLVNYAFFTHRQGYCPQGRVLTNISWIGAVFIGYFIVYNRKRFYSSLFWFLSLLGLIIAVILLQNPSFLYQPTTHEFTFRGGEFFIYLSNLYFYLPSLLPSFIKVNNLGYIPNYVWLGLILLFIAGYFLKKNHAQTIKFSFHILLASVSLVLFFLWFVLYPRPVLLFPVKAAYTSGERVAFYDLGRHIKMKEPGKFYVTKDNLSHNLHFTSWRKIEKMKIEFGSLKGDYQVELVFFDKVLFEGATSREIRTLVYPSPPRFRFKNTNLYRLSVNLKKTSDISTAENPYFLSIQPEY